MSMYLGDLVPSQILDFKVTFVDATGLPTTLSGGAISVYKDNDSVETATGVTLTTPFDSRTGLAHVRINTGADGSFYAAGNDFQVVVTAGTVSGISVVGYELAHFSIDNRKQKVNVIQIAGSTVSTTTAQLGVNVVQYNAQTAQTDTNNLPKVDVEDWRGNQPDSVSSGKIPADVKLWLTTTPATVSTSGYLQTLLQRWLTDDSTGTPLTLDTRLVQAAISDSVGGGFTDDDRTNLQSLVDRVGAFTGSGLNTILGFFRSLFRTNSGTPSDIGGTFDPTVMSLEAVYGYIRHIPEGFQKGTAFDDFKFVMRSSSDHISPILGASVIGQRAIDDNPFTFCTNAVTQVGSGTYIIDLSAADLNGDNIMFLFTAAGADPAYVSIKTSP